MTVKTEASGQNSNRDQRILWAGLVGIIANIGLATVKMAIGIFANSIAVISDAINNFSDVISSVATIAGLKMARRPPDHDHPFGHGRIEYLSGMFIAALVLAAGLKFLWDSGSRIINPESVSFSQAQIVLIFLAMMVKIALGFYNRHVGMATASSALKASGLDAFMDAVASALTLAVAILSFWVTWPLDGYAGVLVSLFIIYSGLGLIKETADQIIGERGDWELVKNIRAEVMKNELFLGVYDIVLHNYGAFRFFGTACVEVPDYLTVEQFNHAAKKIQENVLNKLNVYLVFGLHAVNTYDAAVVSLKRDIMDLLKGLPNVLDIHAFDVHENEKLIMFDLVIDFNTRPPHKYLKDVENIIRQNPKFADYKFEITLDRPFT